MLATSHALTGAAIAKLIPDPLTGYLLAFLSHPILDYIPHWDLMTRYTKRLKRKVIVNSLIDSGSGFLLGLLLFSPSVPLPELLITMSAAQLPDWVEAPYTAFDWRFPPFSWVKTFQHYVHNKITFPDGLYTQLILVFLLLLISR